MTFLKRVSIHGCGLVMAGVLLFAPGEARAANECGTWSTSATSHTCADGAQASGIEYSNIGGEIMVTVTGGAATTINAVSGRGWNAVGAVVVTAASGTGSRDITLNVGTGSNAVVIARPGTVPSATAQYNSGVLVHQYGAGADDATVTLGSGVAIGTSSAPMRKFGVWILATADANTGTATVTSAATIHSTEFGIVVDHRGAGSSVVTNTGSITTSATGGGANDKSGIKIIDWSGSFGADRTTSTTTTVTNSGTITVSAAQADGIDVEADGLGLYKVVNSGTISTSGNNGNGIRVDADDHAGAAGSTAVEVESSGSITTSGTDAPGIYVFEDKVDDSLARAGDVEVTTTGGAITTSGTGAHGIFLVTRRGHASAAAMAPGDATITNAATIRASGANADGLSLSAFSATTVSSGTTTTLVRSGDATIANSGAVTAGRHGIHLFQDGTGDATVTNSGAITTTPARGSEAGHGIYVETGDSAAPGRGTVAVTNSGSIRTGRDEDRGTVPGEGHGIFVNADTGAISVMHSSGTISSADDYNGIQVQQGGTGDVTVDNRGVIWGSGRVRPGSTGGHGIYVEKTESAGSGDVTVTNSGTITAADRGDPARGMTGIRVRARGSGTYKIVHSGTIGGGQFGHGILVVAGDHTGAAGTDAVVIESSGDITTQSSAIDVTNYGDDGRTETTSGDIRIVTTGGEIVSGASGHVAAIDVIGASTGGGLAISNKARVTVSGEDGIGLRISTVRRTSGPVTIANEGAVTAEAYGIYLRYAGPVAATIDNSGTVTTKDHAIFVDWSVGQRLETEGFDKTVTNTGTLTSSEADGIRVEQFGGSATVTTSGTVTAAKNGIAVAGGNAAVVTIAAGATVTAGEAGVYTRVAGAGLRIARKYTPGYVQGGQDGEALPDGEEIVTLDDHLNQVVRVDGTVTGGTDAAVHLDGGGALIVGETGKLIAGAGRPAVLVNDPGPAIIYVDGEVTGSEGADAAVHLTGGGSVTVGLDGRVQAGGAALAVRSDRPEGDDPAATVIVVRVASGRVAPFTQESVGAALDRVGPIGGTGVEDGVTAFAVETTTENGQQRSTGYTRPLSLDDDGNLIVPPGLPSEPPESFQCALAEDERCRLYEALPAALLAMTGLPGREARMSAARDGTGGWARIEAASGTWKAGRATQAGLRVDHNRFGVRAGVDVAAGEDARLGLSAHGLRGTAKTADTVKAKLSGVGFGVHAAAALDGGFHVDAQAAATWFDVDLDTPDAGRNDVKGRGYAASLELGRRMALPDGMTVTPRAGLLWSDAGLGRFQEVTKHDDRARAEVDVTDASSLTGRVGLGVASTTPDGARLFGALDLAHEFSGKRETAVSGTALKSSARKTSLRLGIGGLFDLGDGASLGGSATYALGSGSTFGGALSLDVQF